MRKLLLALFLGCSLACSAAEVVLSSHQPLKVSLAQQEATVVHTALELFVSDYRRVFDQSLTFTENGAQVIIATLGSGSPAEAILSTDEWQSLKAQQEGFVLTVSDGKLYILGSDKRGTAYGILELSRLIGVSPWEWWADSPMERKERLTLPEGFHRAAHPSVAHRGIFLNDEDWGLTPWAWQTHEPSDRRGTIGPQTHERIFQLLLRLRANTFWPAMHACSVPFYLTPGNKEMADRYSIFVGTSHCEPMVRNTNGEWDRNQRGSYDYVHNRDSVLAFWRERVTQLAGSDNIYTLGIRGEHDSKMLGANTTEEQLHAITRVLRDQRQMIAELVNPDVTQVSQVFIPYKEVLDVYRAGLQVPDDVALMWCDDNYGYIRHFPTHDEQARSGGNGIYYHVSYWGRPHDYLWLATTHPALLFTQMKMAYDKGARDQWILNVGDIKPAEYLIELFMDMAWAIDSICPNREGLEQHLHHWLSRELGSALADSLLPVMNEYYRLAYIRKPEYMGNTRTEEKDPAYKVVSDLPWSREEILTRLADYEHLASRVIALQTAVPEAKRPLWYQLVEYPVRGAAEMNRKHLYGQLARHGLAEWSLSDAAHDSIIALTDRYNALCGGKWNRIMSCQPRRLPVFEPVPHTEATTPLPEPSTPLCLLRGTDYASFTGGEPVCYGLGYQRSAIHLPKGASVTYHIPQALPDSVTVEVALAPCHPVEGQQIRYAISLGDEAPQAVDYHTEGRSEEWKQNVLSNRALRRTVHAAGQRKGSTLTLTALDEGVVIDEVRVNGEI